MRPEIYPTTSGAPRMESTRKSLVFFVRFPWPKIKISSPTEYLLHPGRLTWNLQITHLERKMIFQTSMIMFHVNLPGCKKIQVSRNGGAMSLIKPGPKKGPQGVAVQDTGGPPHEPRKKTSDTFHYTRFFKEGSLSWFIVMPISLCSIYSPLYTANNQGFGYCSHQ